jgi:hypothetical protein
MFFSSKRNSDKLAFMLTTAGDIAAGNAACDDNDDVTNVTSSSSDGEIPLDDDSKILKQFIPGINKKKGFCGFEDCTNKSRSGGTRCILVC